MNAPPYPAWEEIIRIDDEGYIGIVLKPCHKDMPQKWLYKVFTPYGNPAYTDPRDLEFPENGQGAASENAERHLHQLLALAKSH